MTGAEVFSGIADILTALAAVGGVVLGVLNFRAIGVVHKTTNSMSERNEAMAKDLGKAIGKAQEKGNPT